MGRSQLSDTRLKQLILFFGAVSFFLGKAALNGGDGSGGRLQAELGPFRQAND